MTDRYGRKPRTDVQRLKPIPDTLTDTERDKLIAIYEANPGTGYKAALKQLGYHGSRADAAALLTQTEIVGDILEAQGLGEQHVMHRIAKIAADLEHKDCFRANTWIEDVIHGRREGHHVDVNHSGSVDNPDVAAAIERFTSTVVRLAERGGPEPPALKPGD